MAIKIRTSFLLCLYTWTQARVNYLQQRLYSFCNIHSPRCIRSQVQTSLYLGCKLRPRRQPVNNRPNCRSDWLKINVLFLLVEYQLPLRAVFRGKFLVASLVTGISPIDAASNTAFSQICPCTKHNDRPVENFVIFQQHSTKEGYFFRLGGWCEVFINREILPPRQCNVELLEELYCLLKTTLTQQVQEIKRGRKKN